MQMTGWQFPPLRNGNHAVNQEWVGNWNGAGGNDYELINVGHRRR